MLIAVDNASNHDLAYATFDNQCCHNTSPKSLQRQQHVGHLALTPCWFQAARIKHVHVARVNADCYGTEDDIWGQHPPAWCSAACSPHAEGVPLLWCSCFWAVSF